MPLDGRVLLRASDDTLTRIGRPHEPESWRRVVFRYQSAQLKRCDPPTLREMFDVIREMNGKFGDYRRIGSRFGKKQRVAKQWVSKYIGLRRFTDRDWDLIKTWPRLRVDQAYPVALIEDEDERSFKLHEAILRSRRKHAKESLYDFVRELDDFVLTALAESDPFVKQALERQLREIILAAERKLALIEDARS